MNTTKLIETIVHQDTGTVVEVFGTFGPGDDPDDTDPGLDLAIACMESEGPPPPRPRSPGAYDPATDPELQPGFAGEPFFKLDVDGLADDATDGAVTP